MIFPAFGTILFLVAAFFFSKLNLNKYSKIDFSSFWHDLGFGGSFFLFKIQFEKVFKNWFFPAFGTILVLVAAFFYSKFNLKKYSKIDFFQLLARSWFWWQLFSFQNSIKTSIQKLFFPAFGTILVLVAAFFFSKFNLNKYSKIDFSSFWHDLVFGGSFFLFKIELKKYSKIVFSSFWHDLGLVAAFFYSKLKNFHLFVYHWKFQFTCIFPRFCWLESLVGHYELMSFHRFVYHWILQFACIFTRFCWLESLVGHYDLMSFHLFVYHWILEFTCIFTRFCLLGSLVGHCDFLSVQPDIFFHVSVKSLFYLCFFRVLLSSDWKLEWGGGYPHSIFLLDPPF